MTTFDPDMESKFLAWWQDSYRNAPPSGHTVQSHVAFAQFILNEQRIYELQSLAALINEEPCH